ncbi:diacylglycerol kinase family lipid kinase [Candidatus Cloacimonadaceae bacterium]
MTPIFFIINPGSRHHKSAKFIPQLFDELKKLKIDYEYELTNTLQDAWSLSRKANQQGYDTIVALGGDGTINKVLCGFYDDGGKRISKAKLGVIHTGTSPDFCKSYGLPTVPALALKSVRMGFSKQISVARIEYHKQSGASQTGYFACCASLGLGARVAQKSNSGLRKYLGDTLGTLSSIFFSLCGYHASDLELVCDGEKQVIKRNYNTFIGKTRYIASGMQLRHSLGETDERLYVLSIKNLGFLNILPVLKAVYSGQPIREKDYISLRYARSIEVLSGDRNREVEFDGDPQGYLPCRISIASDQLELIADEL